MNGRKRIVIASGPTQLWWFGSASEPNRAISNRTIKTELEPFNRGSSDFYGRCSFVSNEALYGAEALYAEKVFDCCRTVYCCLNAFLYCMPNNLPVARTILASDSYWPFVLLLDPSCHLALKAFDQVSPLVSDVYASYLRVT